jgi:hypothetical protein
VLVLGRRSQSSIAILVIHFAHIKVR